MKQKPTHDRRSLPRIAHRSLRIAAFHSSLVTQHSSLLFVLVLVSRYRNRLFRLSIMRQVFLSHGSHPWGVLTSISTHSFSALSLRSSAISAVLKDQGASKPENGQYRKPGTGTCQNPAGASPCFACGRERFSLDPRGWRAR